MNRRDDLALAADRPAVVQILTDAFADDPVQRWALQPAPDHRAALHDLMEVMTDAYFWLGHVYVLRTPAGIAGAALWAPPDRKPLVVGDFLDQMIERMTPHLGDELGARFGELARTNEYFPEVPTWYLGILGVDPALQSKGHGAALVEHVLADCDRTGVLAHLESSNPRNLAFYRRHGFAETDSYRCGGDDGPLMTIMTRQPDRGGTTHG